MKVADARCGGRGGGERARQVLDLDTHARERAIVKELAEANDEIAAAVDAAVEEDLDAGGVRVRGVEYRADARARTQHAHPAPSSARPRDEVSLAAAFRLYVKELVQVGVGGARQHVGACGAPPSRRPPA